MITIVISCCIAVAAAIAATLRYRVSVGDKRIAAALLCIRCAVIALLLCAFLEPLLPLRTLAQGLAPIGVLIDASESMRLFKTDSLPARTIAALSASIAATGRVLPGVDVYAFGDSVRPCADPAHLTFSDRHSRFSLRGPSSSLHRKRSWVILSDGNWSTTPPPGSAFRDERVWYVGLPRFSPKPFCHAEIAGFPPSIPQDSPLIATIRIRGFKNNTGPLDIRVHEKGRTVFSGSLKAASGYFGDSVGVRLPSSTPGRHCFSVDVVNTPDSIRRRLYLTATVTAATLTAAISGSAPTLDKRFFLTALSCNESWKLVRQPVTGAVDVLFVFSWDEQSQKDFARMKPSAVTVFVGCAPCSTKTIEAPDSLKLKAEAWSDSLSTAIRTLRLPSTSLVTLTEQAGLTSLTPMLSCEVPRGTLGATRDGVFPFLYTARLQGKTVLGLAARDVWKLEFLPLAVERSVENTSFINYILEYARTVALDNFNRSFFAYPATENLTDQDSCAIAFDLPRRSGDIGPSAAKPTIRFSVSGGSTTMLDTSIVVPGVNLGPAAAQTIRFRPFPAGTLAMSAQYNWGSSHLVSSDSLFIQHNDAENEIQGQNTLLLDDIATAISADSLKTVIDAAIADWQGARRETRVILIRIEQSWPLFIAIVILLSLEWIVRRKIGLDG